MVVYEVCFFCRFARCFMTIVVCIVVRLVFMSCSIMVSGLVMIFVCVSNIVECGLCLESRNVCIVS